MRKSQRTIPSALARALTAPTAVATARSGDDPRPLSAKYSITASGRMSSE
ncbi:MAG: hypothetical protein AVDCRST_MAG05-2028 [uncultured Rubrobacteraceae bacterium]|uniref:Uncharacterized protein n=1 Tax=uncultured Rubrobacteraceae bacterium TaxID=349277 RepID=A0A6J4SJU2_9ACTN|nr:MAG: hypothetical protein AVDCRST_MAG05-2028 [uncultured Rubrobacteraceae bacterium]